MVARGDLGVEMPPQVVPNEQKRIIHMANRHLKIVITATQMLESMMHNPRPTRAEASDVANAIFDGSDLVMLSGETAMGKYPVEAVRMMARIAEHVEDSTEFPYDQLLDMVADHSRPNAQIITTAISDATVSLATSSNAAAICCSTESGRTARIVARHRPRVTLLGVTPFKTTARRMQLMWGVIPIVGNPFHVTDEMITSMVQAACGRGYAGVGSNVVLTAGIPLEVHGVTNMVIVHTIREEDLT